MADRSRTRIVTTLDRDETGRAVAGLLALPQAMDGARLVGTIGPRTKAGREDPNNVGTFKYLLTDGTLTTIVHEGDNHLRFVHEDGDGRTSRIDLEEVLPGRITRKSLHESTGTALKSVRGFIAHLDATYDEDEMQHVRNGSRRMSIMMRIAMHETIGRRIGSSLLTACGGREPSLSVYDKDSRSTWRLSAAGMRAVSEEVPPSCDLTSVTANARDWRFSRRTVHLASDAHIDALDGMERLRTMLDAQALVAAAPFRTVRMEEVHEEEQ